MSSNFIIVFVGIISLIFTIIVVVNIIKTAKNTELMYQLLKIHFDKIDQDANLTTAKNTKQFESDIHEVWKKIQEENK